MVKKIFMPYCINTVYGTKSPQEQKNWADKHQHTESRIGTLRDKRGIKSQSGNKGKEETRVHIESRK